VTVSCVGLILYMFRTTPCSSSGESIVSIQPLVTYTEWHIPEVVLKQLILLMMGMGWLETCRESDLHTKRSPTQSDMYQRLYWYNWFSWWWAWGGSKHVENWNKYIEKNCASSWSFTKNVSLSLSLSVYPSAWNNSVPSGQIIIKIWYLSILRKSFEKVLV